MTATPDVASVAVSVTIRFLVSTFAEVSGAVVSRLTVTVASSETLPEASVARAFTIVVPSVVMASGAAYGFHPEPVEISIDGASSRASVASAVTITSPVNQPVAGLAGDAVSVIVGASASSPAGWMVNASTIM